MCHDLDVGPFRYLLFAAVAFSLSVYAYRAYRRWIAPPPDPATTGATASSVDGSPTPNPPPSAKPARTKRGLGFTNPQILPSEREQAESESLVQAVIREELARKKQATSPAAPDAPGEPAAGRAGLFAGGGDAGSSPRVSVAAALTGVRLPDDLVPLVGDTAEPDPHHVTFVSSAPPADVGRHLGDELERLGYQVRTESDSVAVATKGDVTLRVTLVPDAANERVDGARRFPTVAPNTVVIDLQT